MPATNFEPRSSIGSLSGTSSLPGRWIGGIQLDDNINTFIHSVIPGEWRSVQTAQLINRFGRLEWIKEDANPMVLSVQGYFSDDPVKGIRFSDFMAALKSVSRVPFILGDGTQYQAVDVTDMSSSFVASVNAGTTQPNQKRAYTMKVTSYTPYAVDCAPQIQTLGTLSSGAGTYTTQFDVSYPGTAFAEPTWQMDINTGGAQISALNITNGLTGESCTINVALSGVFTALFDASGSRPAAANGSIYTPSNNDYGILSSNSLGWGVTVVQGGTSFDQYYVGNVPTLLPLTAPTLPPTPGHNPISVSITATAPLVSARLSVLAPARYMGRP